MHIKVLKSHEIDQQTWLEITEGFNESFQREKNTGDFIDYYQNTALGYSYHALAFDDKGTLAGSTTVLPHWYSVAGEKVLFGLSGGTYVKKEFRSDIFIYQDMINALRKYCIKEGMKSIYGVSNKNSFLYAIKFLGVTHLIDLPYFVLPVRVGNILKTKRTPLANLINMLLLRFFLFFNWIISKPFNSKATDSPVHILFNKEFVASRFKKGYTIIQKNSFLGIYKTVEEEGIKTTYILEYRENGMRSFHSLATILKHIVKKEKPDLIFFVGTIKHFQSVLFKLPASKVPKQLPLTYEILGESSESFRSAISNPNNWEFGLANFDAR